ncbi:hypothetical protein D3C71_1815200 [compost metagenome]
MKITNIPTGFVVSVDHKIVRGGKYRINPSTGYDIRSGVVKVLAFGWARSQGFEDSNAFIDAEIQSLEAGEKLIVANILNNEPWVKFYYLNEETEILPLRHFVQHLSQL